MVISQIADKVDEIISVRHKWVPEIDSNITQIASRIAWLTKLSDTASELLKYEKDEELREGLEASIKEINDLARTLMTKRSVLDELKSEFTRNTLNIGVSGEARVGKSTTLQKITGLTDVQIPTGKGLPVTAVRSEIFNRDEDKAIIEFRSPLSFVEEYLKPHLNSINSVLTESPIRVDSIAEFKSCKLPSTLGNGVPTSAANSLRELHQAQRGLPTYEQYLSLGKKTVSLDELRHFISYPSNSDEVAEEQEGRIADRAYLAVKRAEIYCKFPGLGEAKVGLVDLPGLGEIGKNAAEIHLKGLEDKVDQVFLITKPTSTKGFMDQGIAANIDQLLTIQPGVKNRSDLITIGINVEKGAEESCKTLRSSFEREFNAAQKDDKFEIIDYSAVDVDSVHDLFQMLLQKLSDRLPVMDAQNLEYALAVGDTEHQTNDVVGRLDETLSHIIKQIPLPDRTMNERIDEVSRNIIDGLKSLEDDWFVSISEESEVHEKFKKDVEDIHSTVEKKINNGLFQNNWDAWNSHAKGQVDYYSYYRSEARRIRREIIESYSRLDGFYTAEVSYFQNSVLDRFLQNAGGINRHFNLEAINSPLERIQLVSREFESTIRDEDLLDALNLLLGINFTFRSNVFLQIEQYLGNLANPSDVIPNSRDTKRNTLGGIGKPDKVKIESAKEYLIEDAEDANNKIKAALLAQNDNFNKYLSICISFFNDYLYRKDVDNFKQNIVRALINEYRNYFFEERDDQSVDPRKKLAQSLRENIKRNISDNYGRKAFKPQKDMVSRASQIQEPHCVSEQKLNWLNKYSKNQIIEGYIKRIVNFGAFVTLDKYDALIPISEISDHYILHPSEILHEGQQVRAKILAIDTKKGQISLSMKGVIQNQ